MRPISRYAVLASLLAAVMLFYALARAPEAVMVSARPEGALIVIDVEARSLTLYEGGISQKRYSVAVGKASTPSPVGVFKVNHKAVNWGTGFGARWMGINCTWGKFGIHGTNKPGSIGTSASHGCFRMLDSSVIDLYKRVPHGTTVIVEKGSYGPLGNGLRKLSPGDRGSDVKQLQIRLTNLGYSCSIDGHFGEGTKHALMRFKAAHKLNTLSDQVDWSVYNALGMILFE